MSSSVENSKSGTPTVRLACDICRERKVRCDRASPECGRCVRLGNHCSYHGRKRQKTLQSELYGKVSELQDRLAQAEAELVGLKSGSWTSSMALGVTKLSGLTTINDSNLMSNEYEPTTEVPGGGVYEQSSVGTFSEISEVWNNNIDWSALSDILPDLTIPPMSDPVTAPNTLAKGSELSNITSSRPPSMEKIPQKDIDILHNKYFDIFFPVLPILSRARFHAEVSAFPDSARTQSLSYAVALIGTTLSPNYRSLQQICYREARKMVEICEREDDGKELASLDIFQALVFIVRYELTSKMFTRAHMTLGRAATLAKMLGLHLMDSNLPDHAIAQSSHDISFTQMNEASGWEEMRRSFWALYVFESYASARVGKAPELSDAQIRVFLPSIGDLNPTFTPHPMPFISDISTFTRTTTISSYAAIMIMVSLAREVYEHIFIVAAKTSDHGFWDRHYSLVKSIRDRTEIMQMHLTEGAICTDPLSFSLYLNLYAAIISLHETAINHVEKEALPGSVASESWRFALDAATKIVEVIKMNWPVKRTERDFFTPQATFIGHPVVMAVGTLSRNQQKFNNVPDIMTSQNLLLSALDEVEDGDGYWHKSSSRILRALGSLDEVQTGSSSGNWTNGSG